jgi:tetratricopeptide (TPR) repeat protein
MSVGNSLGAIACVLLLSGCASFVVSGEFASGRQALLANRDEQALGYFHSVAEKDPDYTFVFDLFREGIWTYVGRVQYQVGRYEEARQSLERALSMDRNDNLARLYLGLTLARRSNYAQGLKDIEAGLQGLYDWLDYMQTSRPFTDFWDPLRQIRSEIRNDLDVISGKDIDWPKLIESAEWVGRQMEEEVDRVRRDEEQRLRNRDSPPGGSGVGIGIGF